MFRWLVLGLISLYAFALAAGCGTDNILYPLHKAGTVLSPDPASLKIDDARVAIENGNFQEAIKLAREAVAANPESEEARIVLAQALWAGSNISITDAVVDAVADPERIKTDRITSQFDAVSSQASTMSTTLEGAFAGGGAVLDPLSAVDGFVAALKLFWTLLGALDGVLVETSNFLQALSVNTFINSVYSASREITGYQILDADGNPTSEFVEGVLTKKGKIKRGIPEEEEVEEGGAKVKQPKIVDGKVVLTEVEIDGLVPRIPESSRYRALADAYLGISYLFRFWVIFDLNSDGYIDPARELGRIIDTAKAQSVVGGSATQIIEYNPADPTTRTGLIAELQALKGDISGTVDQIGTNVNLIDKNVWHIFHGSAVSSDITYSNPAIEATGDGFNDLLIPTASTDYTVLPLPTSGATFLDRINYITNVATHIGESVGKINFDDITDPSKSSLDVIANPVKIESTDSPSVVKTKQDQLNQQVNDANTRLDAFATNLSSRTFAIGSESQEGTLLKTILDSLTLIAGSVLDVGEILIKFIGVIFNIVGQTSAITGGLTGKVGDIAYSFQDSAASFDSAVRHGLADTDSALAESLGTLDNPDSAVSRIKKIGEDLFNTLYGEQGRELLSVTSRVELAQSEFSGVASSVTSNIESAQANLDTVSSTLNTFKVPDIEISATGEVTIPSLPPDGLPESIKN
jgi:hypothetical protein